MTPHADKGDKPPLLFVYYARHEWPLRAVLRAQILAWQERSGCDVVAVNVAYPLHPSVLKLPFQAIVYHSTALTLRWYPGGLTRLEPIGAAFAKASTLKIAMPHDDYLFTTPLVSFLERARTDILLSIVDPNIWSGVYAGVDTTRTRIRSVLTHYFDPSMIDAAARTSRPLSERPLWVCYRATAPRAWTGAWGQLKVRVGECAQTVAARRNKATDISVHPGDTVRGQDWYAFLSSARATVGVEGGSSVFDPTGRIFRDVENYTSAHPNAAYQDVVGAVLPGEDDTLRVVALSPRHLEAAATKTAQLLVRGDYSGVLEPWRHYIPVSETLEDMGDAFDALDDDRVIREMTERSYTDIVASGRYGWDTFFTSLFASAPLESPRLTKADRKAFAHVKAWERMKLSLIPLELRLGEAPDWMRRLARVALRRNSAPLAVSE